MICKESSRCCFLDLAVVSLPQWKAAWASSPWCASTPCSPDQLFDQHDNHADHTTKEKSLIMMMVVEDFDDVIYICQDGTACVDYDTKGWWWCWCWWGGRWGCYTPHHEIGLNLPQRIQLHGCPPAKTCCAIFSVNVCVYVWVTVPPANTCCAMFSVYVCVCVCVCLYLTVPPCKGFLEDPNLEAYTFWPCLVFICVYICFYLSLCLSFVISPQKVFPWFHEAGNCCRPCSPRPRCLWRTPGWHIV